MNIIKKALNSWLWKQNSVWKLNILCMFRHSTTTKIVYTNNILQKSRENKT